MLIKMLTVYRSIFHSTNISRPHHPLSLLGIMLPRRSVSNSGSAMPPRPNRGRPVSRSVSPARSERAPEPVAEQEPKIHIRGFTREVTIKLFRSLRTTSKPISSLKGLSSRSSLLEKTQIDLRSGLSHLPRSKKPKML